MAEIAGADGNSVGDIGLSFEQRKRIDSSRVHIAKYVNSHLDSTFYLWRCFRYKLRAASKIKITV